MLKRECSRSRKNYFSCDERYSKMLNLTVCKEHKLNRQAKDKTNNKVRQFQCKLPRSIPIIAPSSLFRHLNVSVREETMTQPRFLSNDKINYHSFDTLEGNSVSAHSLDNRPAVETSVSTLFHAVLRKCNKIILMDVFTGQGYMLALFLRRQSLCRWTVLPSQILII